MGAMSQTLLLRHEGHSHWNRGCSKCYCAGISTAWEDFQSGGNNVMMGD